MHARVYRQALFGTLGVGASCSREMPARPAFAQKNIEMHFSLKKRPRHTMTSPSGYDSLEEMGDMLEQEIENSSPKGPKGGSKKAKAQRADNGGTAAAVSNSMKISTRQALIKKNEGKVYSVNSTIAKIEAQLQRCDYEIWKTKNMDIATSEEP